MRALVTLAIALLPVSTTGCGSKSAPAADKEPPASSAVAPAPTTSAAAEQPPATKLVPTLVGERLTHEGVSPSWVYAVEGAVMVVKNNRVGRIVDGGITWVGEIPKDNPALGENTIDYVTGVWPDTIAAVFRSGNGRAPYPTYHPLTGKAAAYTAGDGGSLSAINGVARIDKSTLVAARGASVESEIVTVRGPKLSRRFITTEKAGCKPSEVFNHSPTKPALMPEVIESTPDGTLVSLGTLCEKRAPSAEVWDKTGKSRIVDLGRWWKKLSYWPRLLKGRGDELFAFSAGFVPVLRYHDGEVEALPFLEGPIRNVLVSPEGKLHASDGVTIFRYEEGKWTPTGRLEKPGSFRNMVMDEKGTIWTGDGAVERLREGPGAPPTGACQTPFVYLYEAAWINEPNFTYPATRKAMASFPELGSLGLVELIDDDNKRHLGITVTSKAQGDAVIAHVKANMKDEDPRFFCFEPKKARRIAWDGKGK